MWRLLPAAVLVELVLDVWMLVTSVQRNIDANIPGGVGRLLLMGTLGALAWLGRVRWARLVFAGLLYFGGALLVVASVAWIPFLTVRPEGAHFAPALFAFALVNLLEAVGATIGGRAMDAQRPAHSAPTTAKV
jgi:hypothetical protein